jgi:hypothetical protein
MSNRKSSARCDRHGLPDALRQPDMTTPDPSATAFTRRTPDPPSCTLHADPERRDYRSFTSFSDPDGNGRLLQEVKVRAPGR